MRVSRTVRICALFFSLAIEWDVVANEPVEDLLAATFRIGQGDHSGTCFFVSFETFDPEKQRQIILVTASHVMEQMDQSTCEINLRTGNADRGYQKKGVPIKIRGEAGPLWTQHPDVDVATMVVELPDEIALTPISLEKIASEDRLIDRTVHVGQEAWISCFPAKLEANEAGWPILRRGSIASYPLFPIKTAKTILIDYSVFGGDSGAPIAVVVNGNLLIVGIASSMQRQTDKSSMPFEERTMHTPMGLSIAVQAAYLRETIDLMTKK